MLAVVLMVAFYILAIVLAGTLILVPIIIMMFGRFASELAVLMITSGCLILWSVLPPRDRFFPPGPRLHEKDHPELFRHLQFVAQTTQQSMPVEVYALLEMNGWVANRGGIMGFGSRRIMGIGIPLMHVLSTQEFRSVMVHEFGHYHGGDTNVIKWIYPTRSACIRTVANFSSNGSSVLSKPFEWYLKLFLWLTQKASRQQELTADALAAKIIGPDAIASSLTIICSQTPVFQAFWETEYLPVLQRGFQTPIIQGYQTFLTSLARKNDADETVHPKISQTQTTSAPYDSHPSLSERLQAIAKVSGPPTPLHDPPAIQMLRDLPSLERAMIRHIARDHGVSTPESISWDDWMDKSGESMIVPSFRMVLEHAAGDFHDRTLSQLAEAFRSEELRSRLINPDLVHEMEKSNISITAGENLGMLIVLALYRTGWKLVSQVGVPPYALKDGLKVEPLIWWSTPTTLGGIAT